MTFDRVAILLWVFAAIAAGGCVEDENTTVLIVAVRGLDVPAVAVPNVYTPGNSVTLNNTNDSRIEFQVDLATLDKNPTSRILSSDGTFPITKSVNCDSLNATTNVLEAAAYCVETSNTPGADITAHVLLPASILRNAPITVEFYHSGHESPVQADRIEIAHSFFYIAAVGDSAMWGNGLQRRDKFVTQVGDYISTLTGAHVVIQNWAVSGAGILPNEEHGLCVGKCLGEVPKGLPSIMEQVDMIEQPDQIDLVLADGCANDVGLGTILSLETEPGTIATAARQHCEQDMQLLLHKIRTAAPQASIVVTGYFPFVSSESNLEDLEQWIATLDTPLIDIEDVIEAEDRLSNNSLIFQIVANNSIEAAVDQVNSEISGQPPIAFADPGFGPNNATFAPDSWLWGLTTTTDLTLVSLVELDVRLFPEDPLLDERISKCTEPGVFHDLVTCIYGSVGHPNVDGAQAYAKAIIAQLPNVGIGPDSHPLAAR